MLKMGSLTLVCVADMGGNILGDPSRFPVSSSSARRNKRSGTDKPKQPQRGLGVAQLEKIRMKAQMGSNPFHGPNFCHHEDTKPHAPYPSSLVHGFQAYRGILVGLPDLNAANIVYGDPTINSAPRWHHTGAPLEQHFFGPHPATATPFFETDVEECENRVVRDFMGSNDHRRSESTSSTEIDLELRLSL